MSIGNPLGGERHCTNRRDHTSTEIDTKSNRNNCSCEHSVTQGFIETGAEIQIKLGHHTKTLSAHHSISTIHHGAHPSHVTVKRSGKDKLTGKGQYHSANKNDGNI